MSIYLDTLSLNSLLKKAGTIIKKLAGDNINQPGNGSCHGEVLSTKIGGKESKKIQEFYKLLKENLNDVKKYITNDKNGILIFKIEKINKIPKLNIILHKALQEGISSAEHHLKKSNKTI